MINILQFVKEIDPNYVAPEKLYKDKLKVSSD
jgi:hypothetical protein